MLLMLSGRMFRCQVLHIAAPQQGNFLLEAPDTDERIVLYKNTVLAPFSIVRASDVEGLTMKLIPSIPISKATLERNENTSARLMMNERNLRHISLP
jgi:hypothetical protein